VKEFITNWRFSCENHANCIIEPNGSFIEKKKIINSLAMYLAKSEICSEKKFLVTLIQNIMKYDN